MDATPSQRPGSSAPRSVPPARPPGRPTLPLLLAYTVAGALVVLLAALGLRVSREPAPAPLSPAPLPVLSSEVSHLLSLLQEARTSQRGYLLLRDPDSLAAHEDARRGISLSLEGLRALALDDPREHKRIERLALLAEQELTTLQGPLTLMRTGKSGAALQALREAPGTGGEAEMRALARELSEAEQERLVQAPEPEAPPERRGLDATEVIVLGSSAFLLVFLGLGAISVLRGPPAQAPPAPRERPRLPEVTRPPEPEGERPSLQRVLRQLPAAVGLFRAADRKCELANPLLERLHGGRSLVGLALHEVHTGPQGARLIEMFNTVLSTGQPYTANGYPLVVERAPEARPRETFVNLTYQPLLDARGQVEAVLLFLVEVTEQVGARRAVEESLVQRQRVESALRESEAHLRRTLKASDVSAWEVDLRTRRMQWSPPIETLSGGALITSPNTLDAFLSLVQLEDRPLVTQRFTPTAGDTGEFRLEYRVHRMDGGVRWHENRGRVLLDDAGQPTKLAGVLLDITPRKVAELSHRESESRFQRLAETVPQLIWTTRADGAAEYFNPRWYEYTGQTPEQARGDGWMRAIHPDDVSNALAATRRSITSGEPLSVEYRLRRGADGAYRWFLSRGLALSDPSGGPMQWIGTCSDIDDAKRGGESLRFLSEVSGVLATSLDHQQTLQQVARLAVPVLADWCVVDALNDEGVMERVEVAHADPTHAELAETLRRHPPQPRTPHPTQEAVRTDQSVYLPEVTSTYLERITHDADHLRAALAVKPRSLVSVPLLARGRTLGVITFLTTSVSGRRYERADVVRLEEVTQRAALALDNARLFSLARAERERAETANRLKDDFLATVSHELRTPLTAMIGWLKLLRDGRLPPAKHARALETVDRNAHAQAQLIEDLLDVSRIVSGKLRLDTHPVHLAGVIQAALEAVRPAAEAKGMRLNAELEGEDDVVMGDASRLQQVVWNLLSNAVKFSPGGHSVWVRLRSIEAAVEITVEDEGPGIPDEFLPHIFERFRRLEGGSTRQHGGLGLGLAIVRHLVELHGGTVHATSSAPGRGALFTVRLPRGLVQPVNETPAADDDTATPLPTTYPALSGRRILVVDDEADSREMLRWTMEDHGVLVTAASSAAEALRLLRSERPELLVSDIGMPGDDGYALITRVRALPASEGGTIAAVALTAYARVEDRARALTAGFDMHVSKPVEPDELLAVLSHLVALSPRG